MNEKMIANLRRALDDILAMSKEELLADFGTPESKYYFAELAIAEKIFCGSGELELFGNTEDQRVSYKRPSHVESEIPTDSVADYNHIDYLCAA